MGKVLQALYGGEIYPERQYRPKTMEYEKLWKEYYKNHEDFIKKIGSPLDKQFIQILDQQMDMFPLELSETFLDGFRLGARMMIEILGDED
ncbi:DUF6809 family protein [Bavariicoccus seileri]|uniref:DUF6809 family protein n=1 Tax=Bavariicoccus seileri TaxID=549685 RepID=UPI0003B79BB9|nr:DUF6809 family protein [Bavariicoccus seileri]